jgi:hypothetical protein
MSLTIGAGDIVEEDLKADAKHRFVTLHEMSGELVFVSEEHIETAVEAGVIDAGKGNAQQVFEGTVGIPALGHFEFTLIAAEAGHGEDAGHLLPRHLFAAGFDEFLQQRVQLQAPPKRQRQIHLTEIAHPLDTHSLQIHLRPWRRRSLRQRFSERSLHGTFGSFKHRGDLIPAPARAALRARLLAQRGHHLLPRSFGRAHGAHQSPVLVGLSIKRAAVAAQQHDALCPPPAPAQF